MAGMEAPRTSQMFMDVNSDISLEAVEILVGMKQRLLTSRTALKRPRGSS